MSYDFAERQQRSALNQLKVTIALFMQDRKQEVKVNDMQRSLAGDKRLAAIASYRIC